MTEPVPPPDESDEDPFIEALELRARQRWSAETEALLQQEPEAPERDEILIARLGRAVAGARRRRWLRSGMEGLGLAASAAVLVMFLRCPPPPDPDLPNYRETVFEGGVRSVRADTPETGETAKFEPASRIRWGIAPTGSVDGPVALRVHATGPEDRCLEPTHGVRIADHGAIEIEGSVGEVLELGPGRWELTLLVGGANSMQESNTPCARDPSSQGYDERLVSVGPRTIEILSSPRPD